MLDGATCLCGGRHPFCGLGEDAQAFLVKYAFEIEYPRGSVLFHEGDAARSVFMLRTGRLKLSTTSREGRAMILRVAEPGEVVGMSSVVGEETMELTAEALERSRVRVLSAVHLREMFRSFDTTHLWAAKVLAFDYRSAFAEARMMGLCGSAKGRLAQLISKWATENRAMLLPAAFLKMTFTHEELASMTGTTRETVTRSLGQLQRDKVIAIHGSALRVLDAVALEMCSTA